MAEALGVVAALIAISELSCSIYKTGKNYVEAVTDAPEILHKLLGELEEYGSAVKDLGSQIAKDEKQRKGYLPLLQGLTSDEGALSRCKSHLEKMEAGMTSHLNGIEDNMRTHPNGMKDDKKPLHHKNVSRFRRLLQKEVLPKVRRLKFPFHEDDIREALSRLDRLVAIIRFAILCDVNGSITRIRSIVEQMSVDQSRLITTFDRHLEGTPTERLNARHRHFCDRRAPGTAMWLLESAKFERWKEAECGNMWIHGIPGCGKPFLCAAVILDIRKYALKSARIAVAYFYFDFNDRLASSVESSLRAIIDQLRHQASETGLELDAVEAQQEKDVSDVKQSSNRGSKDLEAQESPQDSLVRELGRYTAAFNMSYIVIDALDECTEISMLMDTVRNIMGSGIKGLHIFMSSREEPQIASSLSDHVDYEQSIGLQNTEQDIKTYVSQELRHGAGFQLWPEELINETENALNMGDIGLFRIAQTGLANLARCPTAAQVKAVVLAMPATITQVYSASLDTIDDEDYESVMRILMWLTISPTPLRLAEAVDILALNLDTSQGKPVLRPDMRLLNPKSMNRMCSNLVTTTKNAVHGNSRQENQEDELRLAHATVKEFLLAAHDQQPTSITSPYASMTEVYNFATEACLRILNSLQEPVSEKLQVDCPLATHAAKNWMFFYGNSDRSTVLSDLAISLFRDRGCSVQYRNWIQLRGLTSRRLVENLEYTQLTPLCQVAQEGLNDLTNLLIKDGQYTLNSSIDDPVLLAAAGGHQQVVETLIEARLDGIDVATVERAIDLVVVRNFSGTTAAREAFEKYLDTDGAYLDGVSISGTTQILTPMIARCQETVKLLVNSSKKPLDRHFLYDQFRQAAVNTEILALIPAMLNKAQPDTLFFCLGKIYCSRFRLRALFELCRPHHPTGVLYFAVALGYTSLVGLALKDGAKPVTSFPLIESSRNLIRKASSIAYNTELQLSCCGVLSADDPISRDELSNRTGSTAFYALIVAADHGHLEIVKLLLETGADVNAFHEPAPALQCAAWRGHADVVDLLIKHGASIRDTRGRYGSAAHAAIVGKHTSILQAVIKAAPCLDILATVKHHLLKDLHDEFYGSPLQTACECGHLDMVKWLVTNGADPEHHAPATMPPLTLATRAGRIAIMDMLIIVGASTALPEPNFPTGSALHFAVRGRQGFEIPGESYKDRAPLLEKLLSSGANPNSVYCSEAGNDFILPVLLEAFGHHDPACAAVLLKAGADANQPARKGSQIQPPLHCAAKHWSADMSEALIQHGAQINAQDHHGSTALHKAIKARKTANVKVLLAQAGIDPGLCDCNGDQPIHYAAKAQFDFRPDEEALATAIALLIEGGVNVNARNFSGKTALSYALAGGGASIIEILLANGAQE